MSKFSVSKFVADPSAELATIENASKKDLFELASSLEIVTRTNMRKFEIRNLILEYYLDSGEVGSEARQYMSQDVNGLTNEQKLEYERIALEREKLIFEKEPIRLESERE